MGVAIAHLLRNCVMTRRWTIFGPGKSGGHKMASKSLVASAPGNDQRSSELMVMGGCHGLVVPQGAACPTVKSQLLYQYVASSLTPSSFVLGAVFGWT